MQNEKAQHLKCGVLLLIESQEELNSLAEVVCGVEVDALHIDEPYVAFVDDVLYVVPLSQIVEGHMYFRIKPRRFGSWIRSVKRKLYG